MAQILKLKIYDSVRSSTDLYVVNDGDKYYVDPEYGFVEFFYTKEDAIPYLNKELSVPFDSPDSFNIIEWNGVYGIYDYNLNSYFESESMREVTDHARYEPGFPEDKFQIFVFDKVWEEEEDDYEPDYSDSYDSPPNYYDPRYDGPFHYIPPGH